MTKGTKLTLIIEITSQSYSLGPKYMGIDASLTKQMISGFSGSHLGRRLGLQFTMEVIINYPA